MAVRARDLGSHLGGGEGPLRVGDGPGLPTTPIGLIATSAPLLAHQCDRLAQRAAETMTGRDGVSAHRLPHARLRTLFAT